MSRVLVYDRDREPTGTDLVNRVCETAMALAHKWKLVAADGSVRCMLGSCHEPAILPTLLCRQHLAASRRRGR